MSLLAGSVCCTIRESAEASDGRDIHDRAFGLMLEHHLHSSLRDHGRGGEIDSDDTIPQAPLHVTDGIETVLPRVSVWTHRGHTIVIYHNATVVDHEIEMPEHLLSFGEELVQSSIVRDICFHYQSAFWVCSETLSLKSAMSFSLISQTTTFAPSKVLV